MRPPALLAVPLSSFPQLEQGLEMSGSGDTLLITNRELKVRNGWVRDLGCSLKALKHAYKTVWMHMAAQSYEEQVAGLCCQ
eukprot:800368-Pelagomonas_calceolata.AAC.3